MLKDILHFVLFNNFDRFIRHYPSSITSVKAWDFNIWFTKQNFHKRNCWNFKIYEPQCWDIPTFFLISSIFLDMYGYNSSILPVNWWDQNLFQNSKLRELLEGRKTLFYLWVINDIQDSSFSYMISYMCL